MQIIVHIYKIIFRRSAQFIVVKHERQTVVAILE